MLTRARDQELALPQLCLQVSRIRNRHTSRRVQMYKHTATQHLRDTHTCAQTCRLCSPSLDGPGVLLPFLPTLPFPVLLFILCVSSLIRLGPFSPSSWPPPGLLSPWIHAHVHMHVCMRTHTWPAQSWDALGSSLRPEGLPCHVGHLKG